MHVRAMGSEVPVAAGASDTEAERTIRVVLADDSYLVREALLHVLEDVAAVEALAPFGAPDALLREIESKRPDVVVTDIRMPPGETDEGLQVAAHLREAHPEIAIVVLSQFSEPRYALALLEHGSDGRAYLLKEHVARRGQLLAALEAVARGAISGAVIGAEVFAPPAWFSVPFELVVETLAITLIELKLVAELHEVHRRRIGNPGGGRTVLLVKAWAERRGVTPAAIATAGGVAEALGRGTRNETVRV